MHKNEIGHPPKLELVPNVGLGAIRLGDSATEVEQALHSFGLNIEEQLDPYCWEFERFTLSFINQPNKRLVQIVSESEDAQIMGSQLVGLRLDEALLTLGVKRFDDTLWVMTSPDTDFANGELRTYSTGPQSNAQLLFLGVLWIKSLGVGLELFEGKINSVAIRQLKYVPQQGCGPLNEQTLLEASDPEALESLFEETAAPVGRIDLYASLKPLLWIGTITTAAVLCWVITTMINDYRSWQNATPVTGEVVALTPDGPFPDELVVKYMMPDEQFGQVSIPTQYATARAIGEQVELVYREHDPSFAMTQLQSRDHFSSLSMNWLIYLIPLLGLEISMLFPHFNRRRRYS